MALDPSALKALAIELATAMPPPAFEDQAALGLPVLNVSRRARAIRRIAEIANSRGWQLEITRTLDRHEAAYVDDLPEDAVLALRDRMEYFEDCVQTACDPDDAPPAR